MVRKGTSIGFLGRFGRSSDLRALDQALRSAGLHPQFLPEGVKLATLTVMRDHVSHLSEDDYLDAGRILAFGVLGEAIFAAEHGEQASAMMTKRLEEALHLQQGMTSGLFLLLFHARLLEAGLIARHDISVETKE